ncbi:MAG: hypothetical protein AAGF12_05415 [Myxococcota bacterium]
MGAVLVLLSCVLCVVGPSVFGVFMGMYDTSSSSYLGPAYEETYASPSSMGLELPDKQGPVRPRDPLGEPAYEQAYEGLPPPFVREWEVRSVEGELALEVGTICPLLIEPRARGTGYWCQTQVVCEGLVLYGDGSSNGFLECDLPPDHDPERPVWAQDGDMLSDSDGAFVISGANGDIRIEDDATSDLGAFVVEGVTVRGSE